MTDSRQAGATMHSAAHASGCSWVWRSGVEPGPGSARGKAGSGREGDGCWLLHDEPVSCSASSTNRHGEVSSWYQKGVGKQSVGCPAV